MKHWSNGKILNNETMISSFNFAFHYANPVVWEGMRGYVTSDNTVKCFELQRHMQRLHDSAKIMGFEIPYSVAELVEATKKLIKHFPKQDLYIRPIAYLNKSCADNDNGGGSIAPENTAISVDIYIVPMERNFKNTGIKVITSSYFRGAPCNIMQAKTSANYSLLGVFSNEASRAGVDDVLVRNPAGYYTEASTANLFIVKGNQVLTPKNNGDILPGITRETICKQILMNNQLMIKKHGKFSISIQEKDITKADILTADECFVVGTYAEVTPVIELDGQAIGTGEIGALTAIIRMEYANLVRA